MSERKNHQFIDEQINWSDQSASFPPLFMDLYFNKDQTIEISSQLGIEGNRLLKSWSTWQEESFCIAESSFGTGLNFLLVSYLFTRFLRVYPDRPLKRLFFTSFETSPLNVNDITSALQAWPILANFITPLLIQYPLPIPGCHRLHFTNISLDLWFGEIDNTLPELHIYDSGLFDCWYINNLNESSNTNTYKASLFPLIANSCKLGAALSTCSIADSLDKQLLSNGFKVQQYATKSNQNTAVLYHFQKKNVSSSPAHKKHQNDLPSNTSNSKDIAIIGGGISSACLSLALINRGYHVTLYCKDAMFGAGASGNQQGALYPLLNGQHNTLSELFANSFLYARHYIQTINNTHPFDFDLSGLLQLYYDDKAGTKLDKILHAGLPQNLVHKIPPSQTDKLANIDIGQSALFYPLAGWLSPTQMVHAIFAKAQQTGLLTVNMNHQLLSFEAQPIGWLCKFDKKNIQHDLLVLTTAMHSLDFKQCEALPLSAARGQVTHIKTTPDLTNLKLTLCHEGYLTPLNGGIHCMGATFKRHDSDTNFSKDEQLANKQKLQKCVPNKPWVEQIDIDHQDANIGIRCTTRDHFPYMGGIAHYQHTKDLYNKADKTLPTEKIPFHENLFILTGLGSRGLNTAPLLAESLASQINKEPIPLSTSMLTALQSHRQWVNYLRKGKKLKF